MTLNFNDNKDKLVIEIQLKPKSLILIQMIY
jgi:hypothetical protein